MAAFYFINVSIYVFTKSKKLKESDEIEKKQNWFCVCV